MASESPQSSSRPHRPSSLVHTWRWLLQLDRPAPERSDREIAQEVERNYPWNFVVNLLDGVTFWFGLSFISSTTIVPLFISKLTDSPWPIGLVAVVAQGAWFLPQLFTANSVEKLARKKPVVVNLGFFTERLPMWLLVLAPLLALRSPLLALLLFFLGYAWHGLGAGLVATAWQDLLARCFPVTRRGRFLGTTLFLGAGTGAAGAAVSAWILRSYAFPTNFVLVFTIAAVGINLSWVFLALTREPVQPAKGPQQSMGEFWTSLPVIWREDHNFRHFLLARLLLALGGMGIGFVTVAAVQRWQIADGVVGIYTAVLLLGQTAGNLFFGFLADRYGHKLSLELSGLAAGAAFLVAWLAPSPGWYYLVFTLLGVASAAIIVSGILVTLEFSPPARRPTYVGLANTATGIVSMTAPLIGAALARFNYDWLFALAVVINLATFGLMRWSVKEPRWQ
jgi:MFS family permease